MVTIESISAKGFKSFAKKTELVFGKKYNCIIGPNGSGKSNVIDLITFVLGRSSAKQLRAEKSASLIYNGGKTNPPSKEAEASIIFDNTSKELPVDTPKVEVTRKVKQTGNSIYRINGKKMTRQQVLDLLSKAHINFDGHNIVLQGDIVQLMEMRPEERRFVIEEISGISVYEEKKLKATHELEKVESRLQEANIILTERQAYIRELKSERDQAIHYKELETLIKRNKATLLDKQLKEHASKLSEALKALESNTKQHDTIQEAINQLKDTIAKNKEDIHNINDYLEKKGKREQVDLSKEIEQLKESILKDSTRLDALKNELSRIEQRRKQLSSDSLDLENKIASLKKDLLASQQQEQHLKQQESKINQAIAEFRKKLDLEPVEELEQAIDRKQNNLVIIQEKKLNISRDYDKYAYQLQDTTSKLGTRPDAKPSNLPELKKAFSSITQELNKRLTDDSSYSVQLGKARRSLVENNEALSRLKMQNLTSSERTAADLSIQRILKSGIQGIYNTVAGLGNVNKKYSLALEVAAGSRINSIVVEDDAIAAKCINYLKTNRLGIAAFLPLNKIKAPQIQNMTGPGIHGPAIELITFQPKFRNIFAYVFGPTIIIDNVDTARKIGIGRTRMVTLDGDLMESSGAMLGGFRQRKKGIAFKEQETQEEIFKLEAEVARLQDALNTIEESRENNQQEIQQLREKKVTLEVDIMKLEKLSGPDDTSQLQSRRAELTQLTQELSKKLQDIDQDIASLQRELETLKSRKQQSRSSNTKELSELEAQKEKLKESILTAASNIKSTKTQIDTLLLPEKERMRTIIASSEKESSQFSQELAQLTQRLAISKQALKEKELIEKQFYAEFKTQFDKRVRMANDIQKSETSLIREEESIRAIDSRCNTFQIERARLTAELEGLKKEYEPFQGIELRRGIELPDLKYEIQRTEKEIEKLGNINMKALEIYEKLEEEFSLLKEKEEKLKSEKQDVLSMMAEIETKKQDLFMKTFREINSHFTQIFRNLSTKGDAYLELQDKDHPFEGGVTIKVRITGNKFLDIKSLSGGEKTMAALALIFSIQEYQPASFYVLDEVDAALDKTNSALLSQLIQKYSEKAQYIVVSHNDTLISEAGQIYGVSMQQGVSKVVSLKI
ncbi:MAG TPA: chromosome segregation protein SMC [Candidatus Nanoarchaeia archaeon]|nr:chromosome segregation protein SMC [Candidatus Nanoarchaeia archaeon]